MGQVRYTLCIHSLWECTSFIPTLWMEHGYHTPTSASNSSKIPYWKLPASDISPSSTTFTCTGGSCGCTWGPSCKYSGLIESTKLASCLNGCSDVKSGFGYYEGWITVIGVCMTGTWEFKSKERFLTFLFFTQFFFGSSFLECTPSIMTGPGWFFFHSFLNSGSPSFLTSGKTSFCSRDDFSYLWLLW